jgi:hypothetical protein
MPQGVIFTDKEMLPFFEKMQKELGFKVLHEEIVISLIKESLFPSPLIRQKKEKGVEVCLFWQSPIPFLKVYVWTSYLTSLKRTRKQGQDMGWTLIKDDRFPKEVAFYHFPRRRTKNFLKRLYDDALSAKELATVWANPCPVCEGYVIPKMELKKDDKLHEVHFVCSKNRFHTLENDDPFQNIKDTHIRFLLKRGMLRYHAYQMKNFQLGISHTPSRIIRAESKRNKQKKYQEGIDPPIKDFYPDYIPSE